jgi:deoxyadenosine/deoxycytidine kinase
MTSFPSDRIVKLVSIEGNIGAGKSTLISRLKEFVKTSNIPYDDLNNETIENLEEIIIFIKEPLDVWESVIDPSTNKNMIELSYENPDKWAFAFQVMVFTTQTRLIEETLERHPKCRVIVSERSVESGKNIFTKMLLEYGNINEVELQIYNLLFEKYKFSIHTSIFLDIPPDICMRRIKTRGREGEEDISIDYLNKCDYYYRQWLIEKKESSSPQQVYIVDNNNVESIISILMPLLCVS